MTGRIVESPARDAAARALARALQDDPATAMEGRNVDGSLHGREPLDEPRNVPEPAKHRLPRAAAALWVARAILAGVLAAAGALKVYAPVWAVASIFAWVESVPPDLAGPAARLAGVAELAAAVALVVPRWNHVVESLSRVAVWAGGVAAAIETLPLFVGGDRVALRASVAVAGLAAFVAWGRGPELTGEDRRRRMEPRSHDERRGSRTAGTPSTSRSRRRAGPLRDPRLDAGR